MSKSALALGIVLLGSSTLALAAGPTTLAPQTVLKEKDHKKIGREIADYFEAVQEEEGIHDALEDVQEELEKVGKKQDKDDPLQAALSLSADLGRALWYATDYNKTSRNFKGGSVEGEELEDLEIGYAVMAPSKYRPKNGPYPLILAIPGLKGGENKKSTDHLIEDWKNGDIRDGAFVVACDMPADAADWNKISEPSSDGSPGGLARLMYVFRELRNTAAIDFDRVYVAGRGLGGVETALRLAQTFPHLFAGVIGRAGDAPSGLDVTNFRNLPVFFAGAGAGATEFEEAAGAEGFGDLVHIEPAGDEAAIWAWIQENPRRANPAHVSLRPGSPIPNKAYWLEVPPQQSSDENRVDAVIDREQNQITVTGEGIEQVTIYFNDQLVDLGRPVKFVCNGVESEQQIQRNLTNALRLCYGGQNDPGRFYVAFREFDLAE